MLGRAVHFAAIDSLIAKLCTKRKCHRRLAGKVFLPDGQSPGKASTIACRRSEVEYRSTTRSGVSHFARLAASFQRQVRDVPGPIRAAWQHNRSIPHPACRKSNTSCPMYAPHHALARFVASMRDQYGASCLPMAARQFCPIQNRPLNEFALQFSETPNIFQNYQQKPAFGTARNADLRSLIGFISGQSAFAIICPKADCHQPTRSLTFRASRHCSRSCRCHLRRSA